MYFLSLVLIVGIFSRIICFQFIFMFPYGVFKSVLLNVELDYCFRLFIYISIYIILLIYSGICLS